MVASSTFADGDACLPGAGLETLGALERLRKAPPASDPGSATSSSLWTLRCSEGGMGEKKRSSVHEQSRVKYEKKDTKGKEKEKKGKKKNKKKTLSCRGPLRVSASPIGQP